MAAEMKALETKLTQQSFYQRPNSKGHDGGHALSGDNLIENTAFTPKHWDARNHKHSSKESTGPTKGGHKEEGDHHAKVKA